MLAAHLTACVDALEWPALARPLSVHPVVTDPPCGLIEYTPEQLKKRKNGRRGCLADPAISRRMQTEPLPRFTVLK